MNKITVQKQVLATQEFRNKIIGIEYQLLSSKNPNVVKGNSSFFPLTHSFSEGIYVREMSMLKGGVVIGKIHNRSQTWFLMKGKLKIANENGTITYNAPTYVNGLAGAKRVIYALEDSVFVNVHPNPDGLTDLDEIEKKMFSCNWEEYDDNLKQDIWQIMEHQDYYKKIKKKLKK